MGTHLFKTSIVHFNGGKTEYLEAGPKDGTLLIFVHGWIAVKETWKAQMIAFSSLGFRVVAPDTRGYGGSTSKSTRQEYRLEQHVSDMLNLLSHLKGERAIWIGHDWGCGLVWALAAHHPEVCIGVVNMCVPYQTLELGINALVATVNREIYPIEEYPLGQWDYQAFHSENKERAAATIDKDPENFFKLFYSKGKPENYRKPAWTSSIRGISGWFGPADSAPETDMSTSLLRDEPEIFEKLVETLKKNGSAGPNSYYLNHDENYEYTKKAVNGGILNMPVLFIGARWDGVCDTTQSSLCERMRQTCSNLTEVVLDAGHWVAFEKPQETNAAIVRWLVTNIPSYFPGYWSTPFVGTSRI